MYYQKRVGKTRTTWTVVIDLPRDPVTRQRHQKRLSAPTKRELEALVVSTLHKHGQHPGLRSGKLLLQDYLEQWLSSIQPTVSGSSWYRYQQVCRGVLTPRVGNLDIQKILPMDVQNLCSRLLKEGLSVTTVRQDIAVLSQALKQAVMWQILPQNPCLYIRLPKHQKYPAKTLSPLELQRFMRGVQGTEDEAFWTLAALTGLRRGELQALRWENLTTDYRFLTVRETVKRTIHGISIGPTKSQAGYRILALSSACRSALRTHRLRSGRASGLMFGLTETQIIPSTTLHYRFQQLLRRLGLPKIRLHDLRHTYASMALRNRENLKQVSEALGHASIQITADLYSHVEIEAQAEMAERLERLVWDAQ